MEPSRLVVARGSESAIDNMGGPAGVNAGQNIILGNLRAKFIVVFQISKYLEKQSSIINPQGELLACLGKSGPFQEPMRPRNGPSSTPV